MRITFVMPPGGISGGNRVVAGYAERLAARGHAVHVVWQKLPPTSRAGQLRRLLVERRWTPKATQGSVYFDRIGVTQNVAAEPGRVAAADVPDADVVVATWWETAFSVAALPPAKGRGVYFIQHHEVHDHLPSHISRATYFLPLRKITISQWLVDVMEAEYGDRNVALVPNSVDTARFDAPPRPKNAVPTVGFLFSYKPFKGVEVSLEAIARARRVVPELRVVAFGTPEPGASRALPDGARYFRNPPQATIPGIYALCDVWLCGSRLEGFHLPPLEAMACRTPVVSTRIGGPVDLITEGVNGWIVEVGDAEALAGRLVEAARLAPEACDGCRTRPTSAPAPIAGTTRPTGSRRCWRRSVATAEPRTAVDPQASGSLGKLPGSEFRMRKSVGSTPCSQMEKAFSRADFSGRRGLPAGYGEVRSALPRERPRLGLLP